MTSAGESKFALVGYRFARFLVDEAPVNAGSADTQVPLNIEVARSSGEVSNKTYNGRKVIEVEVELKVTPKPRDADEAGAQQEPVIAVTCVAEFVGVSTTNDGNLELFHAESDTYSRSVYWLMRQRVSSLLSMTRLARVRLPFDLVSESEDK
jgi:hypothetical protein